MNIVNGKVFTQINFGKGSRIISGATSYKCTGHEQVDIIGDKVYINGKPVEEYEEETKSEVIINITVEGDCDKIENCDSVTVKGNCNKISAHNGSIKIGGDVTGDVSSHNGNITCGNVGGDIETHNGNISYRE